MSHKPRKMLQHNFSNSFCSHIIQNNNGWPEVEILGFHPLCENNECFKLAQCGWYAIQHYHNCRLTWPECHIWQKDTWARGKDGQYLLLWFLIPNEKLFKVKIWTPPEIYCAARSSGPIGLVWANTFWNIWFGSHNCRRRYILQIYTTWSVSMFSQNSLNQLHVQYRV